VAGQSRPWWGWHRLNRSWADGLVVDARVQPGDLVLDVGAGDGVLVDALLAAGAKVIAIELHPDRVAHLRERYDNRPVTVVRADARDLRTPRRPYRVVANPPFAILKPLLARLLAPGSRLTEAVLVVPRHVARQWSGPDAPAYSRWSKEFTLVRGRSIPAHAFSPPPPKGAVTLVIRRRTR
jgi:23S rRNA (adenine-N6)-dimethyltransferase